MPADQTELKAFVMHVVVEAGPVLTIIPVDDGMEISRQADQLFRTTERIDAMLAEGMVRS